jgi:hypothetical protein
MCKSLYFLNSAHYIDILFYLALFCYTLEDSILNTAIFHRTPLKLAFFSNRKVLWERGSMWISVAHQKENQSLLFNTESCDLDFMCIVYEDNYLMKQGQDLVMTTFCWAVNSVPEWVAIPEFSLTFESRASCHFKRMVVIFTPQTLILLIILTIITQSFCHRGHI